MNDGIDEFRKPHRLVVGISGQSRNQDMESGGSGCFAERRNFYLIQQFMCLLSRFDHFRKSNILWVEIEDNVVRIFQRSDSRTPGMHIDTPEIHEMQ